MCVYVCVCVFVGVCVCVRVHVYTHIRHELQVKFGRKHAEVFSFLSVSPRNWTQISRIGNNQLNLLRHPGSLLKQGLNRSSFSCETRTVGKNGGSLKECQEERQLLSLQNSCLLRTTWERKASTVHSHSQLRSHSNSRKRRMDASQIQLSNTMALGVGLLVREKRLSRKNLLWRRRKQETC